MAGTGLSSLRSKAYRWYRSRSTLPKNRSSLLWTLLAVALALVLVRAFVFYVIKLFIDGKFDYPVKGRLIGVYAMNDLPL